MTAPSTSTAPVVHDNDLEDLEDIGGAETAEGVRVTRDLPPVVKVRAKARRSSAVAGGGGTNTDGVGHRARVTDADDDEDDKDDDIDEEGDDVPEILGSSKPGASSVPGVAKVHVKTFGCSHNHSDSEFMAGQLGAYGYDLVTDPDDADVWVVNTCTVKNPSQSAMNTVITKGKAQGKKLVIAGCVPQGDRKAKELDDLSLIGVTQIDRIVDVVERTLAGDAVRLLEKKPLPSLDLPKVRRNEHVEILPLSTGCLGQCTYCKTKHARGELGSYSPAALVQRVQSAIAEGVSEIWLSSEDTGAYGIDLGTDITRLLKDITAVLPTDGSCMLRLGMTNPPYILSHLDAVAEAMHHPSVYAFLHIPVQAGSDAVMPDLWPVGSRAVLLDGVPRQIPLAEDARGLARHYRIGPAARRIDDASYSHMQLAFDGVGLRPYRPCHLRAVWAEDRLDLTWVRRTREGGDSWASYEVPLGEARELYLIRVRDATGAVRRGVTQSMPEWSYSAGQRAADGGSAMRLWPAARRGAENAS